MKYMSSALGNAHACRSRAPGQGACLKSKSRTITMQGFILTAISAAEKCTFIPDSTYNVDK